MQLVQFNWFLDKGLLTTTADGLLEVHDERYAATVASLLDRGPGPAARRRARRDRGLLHPLDLVEARPPRGARPAHARRPDHALQPRPLRGAGRIGGRIDGRAARPGGRSSAAGLGLGEDVHRGGDHGGDVAHRGRDDDGVGRLSEVAELGDPLLGDAKLDGLAATRVLDRLGDPAQAFGGRARRPRESPGPDPRPR